MPNQNTALLGCSYGNGFTNASVTDTCCAITPGNVIVEVHQSSNKLYYASGVINGVAIDWKTTNGYVNKSGKDSANSGKNPSVVVDSNGHVLEVHASGGVSSDLWYWLGSVASDGSSITWDNNNKFPHSSGGHTPALALNRNGVVVELHVNNTIIPPSPLNPQSMYYWVGTFSNGSVSWQHNDSLNNSGYLPSVSLNNNNVVVEVHSNGGTSLYYRLGRVTFSNGEPSGINWTSSPTEYDKGSVPSVVVTDDGYVFETHQAQLGASSLWQRIGRLVLDGNGNATSIEWLDFLGQGATSYQYSEGDLPRMGSNAVLRGGDSTQALVIQTHLTLVEPPIPPNPPIYQVTGTASRIFDRTNWIGDNVSTLSNFELKQLVVPGSHDAGMYIHGLLQDFAKTQDLNIYGQLLAGVRWFDLRPLLDGDTWYIHHSFIKGPPLADVLSSIQSFMQDSSQELVMLKFSHYSASSGDFSQSDLDSLCGYVHSYLSQWLYTQSSSRLGTVTVGNLLGPGGTALVVCDGDAGLQVNKGTYPGFFNYRDWNSSDPQNGDLTMFDLYSDTDDLSKMISSLSQDKNVNAIAMPQGQQPKFEGGVVSNPPSGSNPSWPGFAGQCMTPNTGVPCDMFLLSWTLTPEPKSVWSGAEQADAVLAQDVTSKGPNTHGQQINILYTDYVEYSRSADVAFVLNGLVN